MEIRIRRTYVGTEYTIGHLYVDGVYFCDTLEPPVRELPAVCPDTQKGYTCTCKEKVWGRTAIPYGTYPLAVMWSQKFRARMVRVLKVPHFSGILIHQGNTVKDTAGCILVGRNTVKGQVLQSTPTMRTLRSRVWKALETERVTLTLQPPVRLALSTGATFLFDPHTELPGRRWA